MTYLVIYDVQGGNLIFFTGVMLMNFIEVLQKISIFRLLKVCSVPMRH